LTRDFIDVKFTYQSLARRQRFKHLKGIHNPYKFLNHDFVEFDEHRKAKCFSVELNFYPDTFPLAHSSDSVKN
jgi:hypothetical protein